MIPRTLDEWTNCIVNDCGIELTKEFAAQRLSVYQNKAHAETKQFVKLYGKQHLENVIYWYQTVLDGQPVSS
ncbi:MAG: hypothetical protein AAFZ52_18090 [Bacteroidota bacterium]